MAVKHAFVSGVSDGADTSLVRPSNWNADHTIDNDTVSEAQLSISDVTTKNASTSAHGFLPKLPNDATQFLNGVGSWVVPSVSMDVLAIQVFS